MEKKHIPVMAEEVLDALSLVEGMTIVDGTCGLGGHARLIAERVGNEGRVFAFDKDARNLVLAQERLADLSSRITYVHAPYGDMAEHVASASGVLLDLGYSSVHVDDPTRGFSFQKDGPLDMRYDVRSGVTAEDVVNGWAREDLATLFRTYGEEPRAHVAAKAIFDARKKARIHTTLQLADVIQSVIPRHGKTHPATRIFQALRIEVNDEFGAVKAGIQAAARVLVPTGRLVILTFHSLEDRLVKYALKDDAQWISVTKKPLVPTRQEILSNPRARSAKLRVVARV